MKHETKHSKMGVFQAQKFENTHGYSVYTVPALVLCSFTGIAAVDR